MRFDLDPYTDINDLNESVTENRTKTLLVYSSSMTAMYNERNV